MINDNSSTSKLKAIFDAQVSILHEKSKDFELDSDDIRRLETLTRAWKTFNSMDEKTEADADALSGLTSAELMEVIRST